jgi:predicted TIM-barrel fold metal-dependent hydrolase
MKKIDTHTHIWPEDKKVMLLQWLKRYIPDYPIADDISTEALIGQLTDNGVEKIINLVHPTTPEETTALNRFNGELSKQYDFIFGFASIVPQDRDKEDILKRAFFDWGLMGLKIHPFAQQIDLTDPRMEPVWICCEKWGRPVYFHTGFDEHYGGETVSATSIRRILQRHPELVVVICHTFFPRMAEGFDLADEFGHIYLDLTGVPISMRRIEPYVEYAGQMETMLKQRLPGLSERVLFGSDHPVGGGLVEQIYADLYSLDLDPALIEMLVYTNGARFIEKYRWD